MSGVKYRQLDDYVYYGDKATNIKQFEWFNTFPFKSEKQFVYVLRTPLEETTLRNLLLDLFPKLFSCDIQLDYLVEPYVNVFIVTFTVHYENFWNGAVEKLFLFCMSYLNTMDFHIISSDQSMFVNFEDNFYMALQNKEHAIDPTRFFNSGMAKLFVSKEYSSPNVPLWGSVRNDLEAIRFRPCYGAH